MRRLVPAALAAAILALPAPAQKLRAEIRAGRPVASRQDAAPLCMAVSYHMGIGKLLDLDIKAGMIVGSDRPLRFTGSFALDSALA